MGMRRINLKRIGLPLSILIGIMAIWFLWGDSPERTKQPLIDLYLHQQGKVVPMNLEEYIKGSVAAEMPASFEIEALKAQAVCARTYAVKKIITQAKYPAGADLSDDITTCQAFIAYQDFAPANPTRAELYKRIEQAVEATRGEIIVFDSQPIDALYCSTCGGYTENASNVWGGQVSYLRSVKCDYCSASPHFKEKIELANRTINQLVGDKGSAVRIKVLTRTPEGRAQQISINDHYIAATVVRNILGLPSTWVDFQTAAETTTAISRGYGHGVGLCQYGANGMAQRGYDYRQILEKYYRGVTFYKLGY